VVVNSSQHPDWEREVSDATDGRGVDQALLGNVLNPKAASIS
jgi:hypothetical protein